MSSNESSGDLDAPNIEVLYEHDAESSEEPPMSEWSSFNLEPSEVNVKRLQYDEGLYKPGSGEVCAKYITMSESSVLRHPYYKYPGITDPGIEDALLLPEPLIRYRDDGQDLYLDLCKEIGISSIRSFYRQLLAEHVNLKYYGINPMGFRALALALKYNTNVKSLDLTDNWISEDGCFHLGEMLLENITLSELNLYGCRIGPEGARRLFANLHQNHALRKINLTKNRIGDIGVQYLAKAIFLGADINNINLCYNDLTSKAVMTLVDAFETHNKLTHLDLSWNTITSPNSIFNLCNLLSENVVFEELNLAWNSLSGMRVGNAIKSLMTNQHIKRIYLNNNKLSTVAITPIALGLVTCKNLITLDMSYNPLTPDDAITLLLSLKDRKVKLQNLYLENVFVTKEFLNFRSEILSLRYRKNTVVTWGGVRTKFIPKLADMREIALNRADALCKKSKKRAVDIALVILELYKENKEPMGVKEFNRALKTNGVILDDDLVEELCNNFLGPFSGKSKTINLAALVDYLEVKWPDRKLPPTPPPETVEKPKPEDLKTTDKKK